MGRGGSSEFAFRYRIVEEGESHRGREGSSAFNSVVFSFQWHFLWIIPASSMFIDYKLPFCLSFSDMVSSFPRLLYFHSYFNEKTDKKKKKKGGKN